MLFYSKTRSFVNFANTLLAFLLQNKIIKELQIVSTFESFWIHITEAALIEHFC